MARINNNTFRKTIRIITGLLLAFCMLASVPLPAFAALYGDSVTLSTVCVGEDGKKYQIMASYDSDAMIPDDASLTASAVTEADSGFDSYVEQAYDSIGVSDTGENTVRLFDISIVSGSDASVKYQPAEGAAVEVKVRLASAPETGLGVVHFGDEAEVLSSDITGRTVSFETTGFSVYAIVEYTDPRDEYRFIDDSSDFDKQPLYLSTTVKGSMTYYMSSGIVYDTKNKINVINRTAKNSTVDAVQYRFEKIPGTEDQYYVYYLDGQTRNYVKMTTNTNMEYVTSTATATSFTVEKAGNNYPHQYYIRTTAKQNNKYWYFNLRKDDGGKGFGGSDFGPKNNLDSDGSRLLVETKLPPSIYINDLNGKTYGIVAEGTYGNAFALSTEASGSNALAAVSVSMRANPLTAGGNVVVRVGEDIPEFTFRDDGNGKYFVSITVGGTTKYLSLRNNAAVLVEEPDAYSHISAKIGTGDYEGKVTLAAEVTGGGTLNYVNSFSCSSVANASSYFYFAEKTELDSDDLVPYTASKISVSDVKNGQQVVVYTRVWDDVLKQYVFYGINHDGSLVRLYDEGETIRWAGTQINTMLWEFTEYYYWLTRIPNYYYDLRNTYSHKYLAPQVHGNGQVLQNTPIGINLNGRRNRQQYSTILAWDLLRYDYAGLKAGDGKVESVRMSKAQDFYFAVMQPEEGDLTTAATIDNNNYGISMKMVEFPRSMESGGRNTLQTEVIGNSTFTNSLMHSSPNLASTDLDENGYPTAVLTGRSMEELFGSATPVNHLFLTEVYKESGYFQYDSTQNFATLLDEYGNVSDTFTVYNELGTPNVSTNSQGHSQFMPYNDINPDHISPYTNVKDVFNEPLDLDNPRLGEQMYDIPSNSANYHFGMEMEASFVQSQDGKDAWGHDIIFEFAGDDDMWFYVDGELVLDLGGIHSALVGKINFSTGEVQVPHVTEETGNHATPVFTTLRTIFANNYIERNRAENPGLTIDSPEVVEYLDHYFKEGTSVFKDYTAHTMKMFYMERGSGASNLVMRFNLTTSQEGQLLLSKEVSGTGMNGFTGAEFPFQIYYKNSFGEFVTAARDPESYTDGKTSDQYVGVNFVNYEGTTDPVKYEANYHGYKDVFFIKAGETADIQFPSNSVTYFIKECRVDPELYSDVYANNESLNGQQNGDYLDYPTLPEVIGDRKIVKYNNRVHDGALMTLSITKELYELYNTPEDRLHYADDDTGFRFRVRIGDELDYYRFGPYYVKNPNGQYCSFDYENQKFVPVTGASGSPVTDFDDLTDEQKEDCCFTTSPSGAVDQIPCDFTIEIRDLLVDTRYKVEEETGDIPKGYNLIGYERADANTLHEGETENSGVIYVGEDPCVIVKNHRGWGLTVEKYWSDDDFMLSHDNIFFAVYYNEPSAQNNTPIPGTLRRMRTEVTEDLPEAEYSLYYYFDELTPGAQFSDYVVKEVALEQPDGASLPAMPAPVIDDDGFVTNYAELAPYIRVIGGTSKLICGGVDSQTNEAVTHSYVATYNVGEPGGAAQNVRTDDVTNTRPGVRIVKTDANGQPLSGAVFGMEAEDVLSAEFVSGDDGLVTVAYPQENVEYTVTETESPYGYSSLIDSFKFTMSEGDLILDSSDANAVTMSEDPDDGMITIAVKNYKTNFKALKVDSVDGTPIEGASFALYNQVMGKNGPRKDYYPITGYESLYSDEYGVIPGIDETLPIGTYYLVETAAADNYVKIANDILFTVTGSGNVILDGSADSSATSDQDAKLTAKVTTTVSDSNELDITLSIGNDRIIQSLYLDPQTLVADFGLDINYNVRSNNYGVPANSAYTYVGIVPVEKYVYYGTESAPDTLLAEAGSPYKGKFGTVTVDAQGNANYKIDTMAFSGEDVFCLAAHVTQINGKAADVYAYEMLTYLPATTVYYEDDFTSDDNYHDGVENAVTGHNFGKWSKVTSGDAATEQAADLAGSQSANIFGYDPAYTECATYSNNGAHKVSVSSVNAGNANKNWPTMEFDFAGTGFDVISVTGCDTGSFVVSVYPTTVGSDGSVTQGSRIKYLTVNTYYGTSYGQIYLDDAGSPTLTVTNSPLYKATDSIIENGNAQTLLQANGKFMTPVKVYYDVAHSLTEEERYYDAAGNVTETVWYISKTDRSVTDSVPAGQEDNYEPNYAYAYAEGWLPDASSDSALYQIPVLKVSDLEYGTYRAIIQPRFSTAYGHYKTVDGYNYYDLYVDSIRIYDPAGRTEDGTLTSEVIQDVYNYADEAYERFTTLKKVVVGAESFGTGVSDGTNAIEGAVMVDGNKVLDAASLEDYKSFGPNSELYLGKDMSVAFALNSTDIPGDVQLMAKKISDSFPTLKITYVDTKGNVSTGSVQIKSSTDLSYSVFDIIGKGKINWTKQRNASYTSGMIIITNAGEDESVISFTNIKWTFSKDSGIVFANGKSTVEIAPKNVSSIKKVMSVSKRGASMLTDSGADAVSADGTVTMTVTTASDVTSIVVRDEDGNVVDPSLLEVSFSDLDSQKRQWTVNVEEGESGKHVFYLQAQSDGLTYGDELSVEVLVEEASLEPDDDPAGDEGGGAGSFFNGIRSFWARFIDLIKRILRFFGIVLD